MKHTTLLLFLIVFIAVVLPFCEGRRHKGWEEKGDFARRRGKTEQGGTLQPIEPIPPGSNDDQKDDNRKYQLNEHFGDAKDNHKLDKEHHFGEDGSGGKYKWGKEHHKGYKHHKEHKFWFKNPNMTTYFVERSLPPNVYLVLEDKGIQVKAAYERLGNDTVLTKVGIRVADKNIVVSANGNLAVDGQEFDVSTVETIEFENGKMVKQGRFLVVQYDNYHVFMKVRRQHTDKKDKHTEEDQYLSRPPRIGVIVAVEKTAVVSPSGFIGARMAIDPTKYTTPETIA